MEISAGTVDDVGALESLWLAMVEHHRDVVGGQWPVRGRAESWAMCRKDYLKWLDEGSGFLFVARPADGGEPVGYAFCQVQPAGPTFDLGESYGEVHSLVVSEEARGSGVGSALLEACKQELRSRGTTYWTIGVVEANHDAVRLYERLGFGSWTRHLLARVDD